MTPNTRDEQLAASQSDCLPEVDRYWRLEQVQILSPGLDTTMQIGKHFPGINQFKIYPTLGK